MPLCQRLKSFLDDHHVRYTITAHAPAFTAQRTAERAHVRGQKMVKPVMVRIDGGHMMVVTTANDRVDVARLKTALHAHDAVVEDERDFSEVFKDCDVGAMPPFGNLYGIPVVVDDKVFQNDRIVFNGGDHTELVEMALDDYERLVHPKRATVTRH